MEQFTKYIADDVHYTEVIQRIPLVKRQLWIGTADIKDLYVARGKQAVPLLAVLAGLIRKGVEIRLIHAKEPGPAFREDFDRYPELATGLERALCPRVHFKLMIFDLETAYIGSANLTGAGIGMKSSLRRNFENGVNTILISPRRIGKTSLVKKVCSSITVPSIKTIYMDIYDCRNEYDFYTRFATSVLQGTSSRIEHALESAKEFSISLGIKPKDIEPETILSLPEKIAREKRAHIVICIDEFQQIGEFPDSLTVQKRLRGSWQHQQSTSYCLFGSKKHMMENIFQSRRMPFYMFGDTFYLKPIPTGEWIPFIQSRFASKGKFITAELAEKICSTVDNHSSYVQQLAWNVLLQTDSNATEQNLKNAVEELLNQCSSLFTQQTESLSSYQMNFLKAVCSGIHSGFGHKEVTDRFDLGSKSNIARIQKSLTDKELIDKIDGRTVIADPVLRLWLTSQYL